ncbi:hypothetical protein, partial [Bacillus timonensis]|uniref:hypothetical protein n=1 Tax=Bacillus timonensis TaxID=1033734 RepID=UPI00028A3B56
QKSGRRRKSADIDAKIGKETQNLGVRRKNQGEDANPKKSTQKSGRRRKSADIDAKIGKMTQIREYRRKKVKVDANPSPKTTQFITKTNILYKWRY